MRLTGWPPAVVGDARATLEGVRLAIDKGLQKVIIEGDNCQLMEALQNRIEDPLLPLGTLVSTISSLSSSFLEFSSSFVQRTGNLLAHALILDLPADLATTI